ARRDGEPASGAAGNGSATGGNGTSCVRCSDAPPMDFDEVQAVQNPLEFGDDPGTTCAPFSNPNRILGARPFFTVLRVDQPEIGAESSIKVSRPIVLELAQPLRSSVLSASFLQNDRNTFSAGVSPLASDVAARLSRSARVSLSTDVGSAAVGAAKSVLEAVARPASAFWQNWVLTRTKQRASVSPRNPIEWEGDPAIYQAASVAGGHILEYRVQWRSNGYSLGKIAHTLTLAPRQTRRISKVSWRRRETASRRERTAQRDEVEQTTLSSRDYYDAVQSSLS